MKFFQPPREKLRPQAASNMADQATGAANDAANAMAETAKDAAAGAVEACRSLAERGAWDEALDVCRRAHEMLPDDMALEHAYQQAQSAAGS